MRHTIALLSALLVGTLAPLTLGQEEAPAILVRGLRIIAPADESLAGGDLRAFNWFDGTAVAILLPQPTGGVISVDEDACTLDSFTDDKGTNLLEGGRRFGSDPISDAKVSDDGKAVLIELSAPNIPAPGATRLLASGSVVIVRAGNRQPVEHPNVALKPGTAVAAGPLPFTVSKAGKPEYGDHPLEVELEFKQAIDALAEVRFLDAQGNAIDVSPIGTMTMVRGDRVTVRKTFMLSAPLQTATIVLDLWTDLSKVSVPFKVDTSVGLSQ